MKNNKEQQKKKPRAPAPPLQGYQIEVTFTIVRMDDGHVDIYTFREPNNGPAARRFNRAKSGETITWTCDKPFLLVPSKATQFLIQDPKTRILVTPTKPTPVAYGSQANAGMQELTLGVQGKAGDELDYILLAGVDCSDLKMTRRLKKKGGPWHMVSTPIVRATIILAG